MYILLKVQKHCLKSDWMLTESLKCASMYFFFIGINVSLEYDQNLVSFQ